MGKVIEKKRKKKKGRPSLLDLHKRNLKQQKHLLTLHNKNKLNNNNKTNNNNNNNNSNKKRASSKTSSVTRRSTRRNPKRGVSDDVEDDDEVEEEDDEVENDDDEVDDDEVEEGENEDENCENTESTPVENEGKSLRKRKIDSISRGSDVVIGGGEVVVDQVKKESIAVTNQTGVEQGTNKQVDGPVVTPLPDKKLLLFILDRLQKKDTYGVFAEPVDQDELPDYHEIIDNPMDFTTVRKKLDDGSYGNLERFEKDIFLICSNAMQYNAPDTVYYRQACSIQELARKNFENLRQENGVDNKELDREPKIARRGRPPKNIKRPPGRPPLVRANSDFSEAALATAGGATNPLNNESKKGSPHLNKYASTDSIPRALAYHNSDSHMKSAERFDRSSDLLGSASKGISVKHGKRQIVLDETRRNTYNDPHALARRHDPSVLATFHRERKQLIAVGLHTEYGYARSLAQFASKLGPVAWKVASKKIERCLPTGVKFGQGWVGENEALTKKKQLSESPDVSRPSSTTVTVPSHDTVDSGGNVSEQKPRLEQLSNVGSMPSNGQSSMVNMVSTSTGPIRSANSVQIHQIPAIQSRVNGVNGTYGLNFTAQMGKMIGQARPNIHNLQSTPSIVSVSRTDPQSSCPPATDNNGCEEAAGDGSADGAPEQKVGSKPPDLNVGFQSPDLALQL